MSTASSKLASVNSLSLIPINMPRPQGTPFEKAVDILFFPAQKGFKASSFLVDYVKFCRKSDSNKTLIKSMNICSLLLTGLTMGILRAILFLALIGFCIFHLFYPSVSKKVFHGATSSIIYGLVTLCVCLQLDHAIPLASTL